MGAAQCPLKFTPAMLLNSSLRWTQVLVVCLCGIVLGAEEAVDVSMFEDTDLDTDVDTVTATPMPTSTPVPDVDTDLDTDLDTDVDNVATPTPTPEPVPEPSPQAIPGDADDPGDLSTFQIVGIFLGCAAGVGAALFFYWWKCRRKYDFVVGARTSLIPVDEYADHV